MADGKETLKSDEYFAGRWKAPQPCRRKTKLKETPALQDKKAPDRPE